MLPLQAGKQIYLGGFDEEEQAALAYDLAALKFRGVGAVTNFDIANYAQELEQFDAVRGCPLPHSVLRWHMHCMACVAQTRAHQHICESRCWRELHACMCEQSAALAWPVLRARSLMAAEREML